ncbi:MAG: SAM-dependent methyltransferase [Paracoccaceae bacterium]
MLNRLKTNADEARRDQVFDVHDGDYDYIPIDAPRFLTLLIHLDQLLAGDADYDADGQQYRPVTFPEVGCGPGSNLLLARHSNLVPFSALTGFDINPAQVALGQQAFGLDQDLHVADVMNYDYSAFDVVFCLRPFSDDKMQRARGAYRPVHPT